MPKRKRSKPTIVETPEPVVLTEKEQLQSRQEELLSVLNWLEINKVNDIGQLQALLEQVNVRLTQV